MLRLTPSTNPERQRQSPRGQGLVGIFSFSFGMYMEHLTPLSSLLGGALIGLSATLLLLTNGRAAGISGILSGLFTMNIEARSWRGAFLLGLLLAGLLAAILGAGPYPAVGPLWRILVAGVLVGFGTRLGEGCTSGHGVCGLSRLSLRSLVATMTFMGVGMASVWAVFHLLGGTQ